MIFLTWHKPPISRYYLLFILSFSCFTQEDYITKYKAKGHTFKMGVSLIITHWRQLLLHKDYLLYNTNNFLCELNYLKIQQLASCATIQLQSIFIIIMGLLQILIHVSNYEIFLLFQIHKPSTWQKAIYAYIVYPLIPCEVHD